MKAIYSVLFSLFVMNSAFAQTATPTPAPSVVNLIDIEAEYYPKEVYHLGYTENPDHTIRQMYYENDVGKRTFYSFSQLKEPQVIITAKDGSKTYDLVSMSAVPSKIKGNFEVTLGYMTNGLTKKIHNVEFELRFNAQRVGYDVYDVNAEQYISRAYVYTNFWNIPFKGRTAVGISGIKTFK